MRILRKRLLIFFFLLKAINVLCGNYNAVIDGVYYCVYYNNTATVTYREYEIPTDSYTGDIIIPETIHYQGKEYIVTGIDHHAFYKCESLVSVLLPQTVKEIGDHAFNGCLKLKTINIPNGVTCIRNCTFESCSSLLSLSLPHSVIDIQDGAFFGCHNLETIDMPGVISINNLAFSNCKNLSILSLPNCLENISSNAFGNCENLKSVTIPSSVSHIGYSPFSGCIGLMSIVVDHDNLFYDSRENCNAIINTSENCLISGCQNTSIPNSVIGIERGAFESCKNLTLITIPSGVTRIWDFAFNGCSNLSQVTSDILVPFAIQSNVFYQIPSNAILYVPKGTKSKYQNTPGWANHFAAIIENVNTYILSITASGGGGAVFNSNTVRNTTKTFTLEEGTVATITLSPDNGYRVKSLKVNDVDRSLYISNNQYTISNISSDTSVEVEFEEIPPMTYTLSVKATGEGYASYNGTTIRNTTKTFTVIEGTNATISFSPDNGYRIKSVRKDGSAVSYTNNQYTVSNISSDTSVEVEFEEIPPTTYTLSVKATGEGYASYNGTTIRNTTKAFSVIEGTNATISFSPDSGYRIKSVKKNGSAVNYSNNQYTVSNITSDTSVEVEFEEIPPTTYTLSVKATGEGYASYNGTTIRNTTKAFTIIEGTNATISFSPNSGYRIKSVKKNGSAVNYSNNQYTVSNITSDTSVEVEFEEIPLTTYTLSVKATGEGYASYNGTTIRNTTKAFTVTEGTNATISFSPNSGYRIKSIKKNGSAVNYSNNQYTVSNISSNTSVEVEFEEIPPVSYSLTISASGYGYALYKTIIIRNNYNSFSVTAGSSATISFHPNNGYQVERLIVNNIDRTSSISNNQYTISNINANTTVEVEFEEIPPATYTMTIAASGSGYASYGGYNISNGNRSYTLNEGASATISLYPSNGYRVKSLKVNNVDKTSYISNNQYTVSNISANTTVSIVFEAIPTYTLTVNVLGNGYATYGGYNISNGYRSYTLNEGASATIDLYPSEGYRIKSLKVNNIDRTSSVTNNKYTVSNITANTTVTVEFEAIPVTTYSLSIKATGNGSAIFNSVSVRNTTRAFSVNKGANAVITLIPDNGYRIKSLKINSLDRTSVITNNQYTISNISANTTVEVEFEAIPPAAYNLYVKATGNGYAWYNGTSIKNTTKTFSVNEGASATIVFSPESGYRIKCITVNNVDKTSEIADSRYTINSMTSSAAVEVEFEVELTAFNVEGINYRVVSNQDKTIKMASGNYGKVLEVPAMVSFQNSTWKVVGTETDALENNQQVTAIIWNPETAFTASVKNPNLLLYVKAENYAPTAITNVVVNGKANNIVLHETDSGNNFYCPQAFNANKISFTHRYSMNTGIGEPRGWETIALPFDVQKVTHESKGEIIPFSQWESGYSQKPFWLKTWGDGGWVDASSIKANTPYIISMPNNEAYHDDYRISGVVTFRAENATVESSSNLHVAKHGGKQFVPTFEDVGAEKGVYSLNVRNDNETDIGGAVEGSRFILNLRKLHPFEAYMTMQTRGNDFFDISDDMGVTTQEEQLTLSVYNLKGQMMKTTEGMTMEEIRKKLPKGIYIVNGKKMMIK